MITLGVIGVVSALTLPILVKNHQKQVFVSQLKKVVSELSQAAEKAIQENNAVSLAETKYGGCDDINAVRNFILDNFKVTQDCGRNYTPCFANNYYRLNGNDFDGFWKPLAVFSLADGTSIAIFDNDLGMVDSYDWHGSHQFFVDLNGIQGPNILGRDLFFMSLYSDGKVAESYSPNGRNDEDWNLESCKSEGYGSGCLTKIMHDGWKMDY